MNDIILYLWLALFFVVNPLFVFFISRGKRPSFWGKAYMLLTVTMFSLFFFGLYSGKYLFSLVAVGYLVLAPVIMKGIASIAY